MSQPDFFSVVFFDRYTKEYKGKSSEFEEYMEKLGADDWKLIETGGVIEGKGYRFRRYHFRRAIG